MTVTCASKIDRVVVHARGAIVSRLVEITPNTAVGPLDLVVEDLPIQADPGSIRASVDEANWQVNAVRSSVYVSTQIANVGSVTLRLNELSEDLRRLQTHLNALKQRRKQIASMKLDAALSIRSFAGKGADRITDCLKVTQLVQGWLSDLDKRIGELTQEVFYKTREKDDALCAENQASTADRLGEGRPSRKVNLLLEGSGSLTTVRLQYLIQAARWWPLYTLRLNTARDKVSWNLEALISQLSGEDWRGVKVSLSTADLITDARLPELASLRLGRAQPRKRSAYRPAPADLNKMFAAYDSAFGTPPGAPKPPSPDAVYSGAALSNAAQVLAELGEPAPQAPMAMASMASYRPPGGPPQPPCPAPSAAPGMGLPAFGAIAAAAAPLPARVRMSKAFLGRSGSSEGEAAEPIAAPEPEPEIEPSDAWLDFDSLRLGDISDSTNRGRLRREADAATARAQRRADSEIASICPAQKVKDPLSSRGLFDCRYDAQGLVEIPSDSRTHRISVFETDGEAQMIYRSIPREEPEVYRELIVKNPFAWPVLDGPAEVYSEGSLVASTDVSRLDKGGTTRIGLNIEDRIRVARNVRVEEETAGLLGGTTVVNHLITIDVASSLASPIDLEIVDRVPDTDDRDVEIKLVSSVPQATKYTQAERGSPVRGGLSWRLSIPKGGKGQVEYKYRVAFSSKSELVGGNRRD